MKGKVIKRGDIYYANLDPVFGSEQGGFRPVVVVQNDIGNQHSPTVIVATITSRTKTKLPTHVPVKGAVKSQKYSVVLLEQLRTIDKGRLRDYGGCLSKRQMQKVDKALQTSLEIRNKNKY